MGVNWLDNVIGVLSPVAKARRVRARALTAALEDGLRKYEGAGRGKRTKNWHTPATSANAEVGQDLAALRNRSRDLVRNNCYARRGIAVIRENVVGTGIITEIKAKSGAKARRVDGLYDSWAERTWCDYDGVNDIYGLQALAISTVAESGECLIRLRRPPSKAGLPVPLQLQVLEGDYLATGLVRTKAAEGNEIIQGIEFDANGQRVAYHLFDRHPGDPFTAKSMQTLRVPAVEILHLRDIGRAGQLRGVPWLSAAIIKLRELDEYEDAQLVRQKVAACFAAFVKDLDATGEGSALPEGEIGERLMPGTIQHLPAGKEIVFGNPPAVTGYKEFVTAHVMTVAASLGVTYEALAGDYCVAPETRVLRSDLRWVAAETLEVGDEIIAFDEEAPGGMGHRRKWRKAHVIRASRKKLNRRRIVTDLANVTVSDHHLFLCINQSGSGMQARSQYPSRKNGHGQMWVRADKIAPGDKIAFLCSPWNEGHSYLHGYLKGMADGEGWVDRQDAKIGIAQNPGPVFDEVGGALRSLGFIPREFPANGQNKCRKWLIQGMSECLRFLGEVRPTRLLQKADSLYLGRMLSGGYRKSDIKTYATVQYVENMGDGEVVTLETSTHTLITEGLCSHNSNVNFSSARMGWLEFQRNITGWQQRIMTAQFLRPLFDWFREAAELSGYDVTGIEPDFTYPRREMIDPTKEIPAMTKAVRAGLATLPQAIKSLGFDSNKQLEEIAETNKTIDALGLVLDSDPRKVNESGGVKKEVIDEKDTDS